MDRYELIFYIDTYDRARSSGSNGVISGGGRPLQVNHLQMHLNRLITILT